MSRDIVVAGDSLSAGWANGGKWDMWLSMMLRRKIINKAVGGRTTQQVKANIKADVLDLHPEYCILLMGTNDVNDGTNRLITLDNYEDVLNQLLDSSIKPIVISIPPRKNAADKPNILADIRVLNNCLLHMCNQKGIPFVDIYNVLAEDNGDPKANVLHHTDKLHWNGNGALIVAKEVFKAFEVSKQNTGTYFYNVFKGDYPLLENGAFANQGTTTGLADGWTKVGNVTTTLESNPNGGQYQVLNKASTTKEVGALMKEKFGGLTENATYKFQCDFEVILTDKTDTDGAVYINFDFFNASGANIGSSMVDEIWYITDLTMTEIYHEFIPPAGTTSTTISFSCNSRSPFTMKVGRAYINVAK